MKETLLKGLGFGLTSGVITTLGIIVGLHAGTHSKLAVLAGMLVLAVADALSDAIGIHISEEAEGEHATKEVWEATLFAFSSKFGFTLTFVPPIVFLELSMAILVSIVWGLFLIVVLSLYTAKLQNKNVHRAIAEHLFVTVIVIIFAQYIGNLIHGFFGVATS
jgi:VIT1/CCC1 family predicted Fe2+/Mn2+ transporter